MKIPDASGHLVPLYNPLGRMLAKSERDLLPYEQWRTLRASIESATKSVTSESRSTRRVRLRREKLRIIEVLGGIVVSMVIISLAGGSLHLPALVLSALLTGTIAERLSRRLRFPPTSFEIIVREMLRHHRCASCAYPLHPTGRVRELVRCSECGASWQLPTSFEYADSNVTSC